MIDNDNDDNLEDFLCSLQSNPTANVACGDSRGKRRVVLPKDEPHRVTKLVQRYSTVRQNHRGRPLIVPVIAATITVALIAITRCFHCQRKLSAGLLALQG